MYGRDPMALPFRAASTSSTKARHDTSKKNAMFYAAIEGIDGHLVGVHCRTVEFDSKSITLMLSAAR